MGMREWGSLLPMNSREMQGVRWLPRADELFPGNDPDSPRFHAYLRRGRGAGAALASRAVAVAGATERRLDLEPHAPTETAAPEWLTGHDATICPRLET